MVRSGFHLNSNWKQSELQLEKLAKSHRSIKKCDLSKCTHFCNVLPLMKKSQNGPFTPYKPKNFDLEAVWISPQKLAKSQKHKNPRKTEKNIYLKNPSSMSLAIPQIHKCTKFHTNRIKTVTARPVTNFIRQTDTQTDDRQTDKRSFYCSFSVLGDQNVQKKSFS